MGRKTPLKERLLREYARLSKIALREPRNGKEVFTRMRWEKIRNILWRRYDYMSSMNSVRFVTHKGNSFKISTITKRGRRVSTRALLSTMDRPWTPNHSKTTRFRESNPVVKFKGEPPF